MATTAFVPVARAARRWGLLMMLALGSLAACSPAAVNATELVLPARTLQFRPSRDDVTVKAAWLQVRCLMPSTGGAYGKCRGFTVNGQDIDADSTLFEFAATAPNTVEMAGLSIRFSGEGSLVCIALRAIFHEVPHNDDVDVYAVSGDRASLLSYCSGVQPDQAPNRYPFEQNRVRSIAEFVERLSRPIEVRLKPGPLPR